MLRRVEKEGHGNLQERGQTTVPDPLDMLAGNSSFELQRESAVPLYLQLAGAVEKAVQEGTFAEGARIPSEQELIKAYRVSRVTVRLAMKSLFEKKLIVRKQGLGTFVGKPMISQPMDDLFGYYPALLRKGLNPRIQILEYRTVSPDPEVRENLHLSPDEKVLRFIRQYFLEKDVRVVIEMNIPEVLSRHWTERDAAVENSFHLLQERAGVQILSSAVKIKASVAFRELGRLLNLPPGSPVLELRRLTYSLEQKPVEYAILHFPGDSYELTARLQAGDWKEIRVENK
jgi:GntR family transcriptional regulator